MFLSANLIQAALDQGANPKKIKAIPINKLMSELKSLSALFISTENIIRGILNKRTMTLPIEKFVLFNKFIDAEIEPKQDKINDPIIKVKIKYIHVPSAWLALLTYAIMTIYSIIGLAFKIPFSFVINKAIAPVGAVFTLLCLSLIHI